MSAIFFHLLLVEKCVLFYRFIKIINNSIYGFYSRFEFRELKNIFNEELEAVRVVKYINYVSLFFRSLKEIVNLKYRRTGICYNKINKGARTHIFARCSLSVSRR
jgi:hypothetical protein